MADPPFKYYFTESSLLIALDNFRDLLPPLPPPKKIVYILSKNRVYFLSVFAHKKIIINVKKKGTAEGGKSKIPSVPSFATYFPLRRHLEVVRK